MNKQELQNEIIKTKEHLANMEKMLAECEYERWKPEYDRPYWYVNPCGEAELTRNIDTSFHGSTINFYNCFQTREQAEAEAEKILARRMLEDIARRLNKDEKIDWTSDFQTKYYIELDMPDNLIKRFPATYHKAQGVVYCLDENFLNVAIQEIGEERLKKYLRGE